MTNKLMDLYLELLDKYAGTSNPKKLEIYTRHLDKILGFIEGKVTAKKRGS